MFHAKFQNHINWFYRRRFLKVFTIYGHGGHLDYLTWTIYTNFHSPFPLMFHVKFGFDWPSGFGEEMISGRLDRPLSKCLCYIHICFKV